MRSNADPVLHREPTRSYPTCVRGEGIYLYDATGRRLIDGAGGVFVVNLGHGVAAVADAMAEQAKQVAFVNTSLFTSEPELDFAERLLALAPPGFTRAWISTSGSTANETAIKLARLYHLARGEPARTKVVSRWNSYHGSTIGALSATGHTKRREPFTPYLLDFPKIDPPYCYRCPLGRQHPECGLACADELEAAILRWGAGAISAFIVEPVSGGPLAALVPPDGYLARIRDLCARHGVLMIADEVITGAGRTGRNLGIDHWDVVPDIITMAKGIGGGYVPVGAVLVHERVVRALEEWGEPLRHGETFTGQAVIAAAGREVLRQIAERDLVSQVAQVGAVLGEALGRLRELPLVGDVRGIGLLWGVEFVADKTSKAPFPRALGVAERVTKAAFDNGLVVTAGIGGVDGQTGDAVSLSPPFILRAEDAQEIAEILAESVQQVADGLDRRG